MRDTSSLRFTCLVGGKSVFIHNEVNPTECICKWTVTIAQPLHVQYIVMTSIIVQENGE